MIGLPTPLISYLLAMELMAHLIEKCPYNKGNFS